MLGVHRAEDSALVQSSKRELSRLLSEDELCRSAVLELGGSGCAAYGPVLVVEESLELRNRFVSALQILRLYRSAAQRLEAEEGCKEQTAALGFSACTAGRATTPTRAG